MGKGKEKKMRRRVGVAGRGRVYAIQHSLWSPRPSGCAVRQAHRLRQAPPLPRGGCYLLLKQTLFLERVDLVRRIPEEFCKDLPVVFAQDGWGAADSTRGS